MIIIEYKDECKFCEYAYKDCHTNHLRSLSSCYFFKGRFGLFHNVELLYFNNHNGLENYSVKYFIEELKIMDDIFP